MSSFPLWGYLLIFAGASILSTLLTPLALAVAVKLRFLDHPAPNKAHQAAVPYLGGAAIVSAFVATVLIGAALRPPASGFVQLVSFLGLGLLLAGLGLLDDVRAGLSPWLRLVVEIGAATIIWISGDSAHLAGLPDWLNGLLSIGWIVAVTNAFNLLDNMDGLSAGVASLSALTIFGIAVLQGRYLVAALAAALAGCAIGFLRHNYHPARIYMGDAGSLFLGFVLSVLLLKLRESAPTRVSFATILAVPGIALFDTTLVVFSRIAHRRNPMNGGQDHTSHRLVRLGYSVPRAVVVIYAAAIVLDGTAIAMSQYGRSTRIVGVIVLVVLGLLSGAFLARVPVYTVGTHIGLSSEGPSARKSPDTHDRYVDAKTLP